MQLNGGILKSLNRAVWAEIGKEIWRGRARPKFFILFRAGPNSGRNLNFSVGPVPGRNFVIYFGLGRVYIAAIRNGPDPSLKNPA